MNKTIRWFCLLLATLLLLGGLGGCNSEGAEVSDSSYFEEDTPYNEETLDKIPGEKEETPKVDIDDDSDDESPSEEMVWIPKTGSKYHKNSNCSNMKKPSKVTKSQAISWGYEPCKKCY